MTSNLNMTRRTALTRTGAALALSALPVTGLNAEDLPVMEVVKTPTCGCCTAWIDMAREAGFEVSVTDTTDYAGMKKAAGVPRRLASCHTARIGGYVVEGHVPFAAIRAMLRDRPDIVGISVPGMPTDSPGMGGKLDAVVPVTAWGGQAGKGAAYDF
jgi:hypothetical protein